MKKIAMLHWAFPPIIGGVETHLVLLCPELIKRGWQVELLTGAIEGRYEEYVWEGMRVKRTPLMDLNSLNPEKIKALKDQIREELEQFIEEVNPDIIHAHNMHYFSPVHAKVLDEIKRKREIPLVLTSHNVWEDELWDEMNRLADIWDMVISVSQYIKDEMVKVGYRAGRIVVVHHGIDHRRFHPPTEEEYAAARRRYPALGDRPVIFHPARMSLDKGCHISVKALRIIKERVPDVMLVLAGTGKTVDWGSHQQKHVRMIMDMIEEYGLKDNVYVQFFPWEEIPYMYQAADICIYPSCFEEPFGLVMLEAMATGRPIVVSRAGGMPEVVKDGQNGFIVEMKNEEELADRCLQLLLNPDLAEAMGKKGREMVEKHYTKEIMTEKTINVYEMALENRYYRLGR